MQNRHHRRGAAVIELAVCLPLLVLIALATTEACAMVYLKQSLKIAAYEGARVGIVDGADSSNVEAQCGQILATRNIQGFNISMTPSNPSIVADGDFFAVTVSAPCVPNSLIGGWFYQGRVFAETVQMVGE